MGREKKYPHQQIPKHGQNLPLCLFKIVHGGTTGVTSVTMWREHTGSFFSQGMIGELFDLYNEAKLIYEPINTQVRHRGGSPERWYPPSFDLVTVTGIEDKLVLSICMNFKIGREASARKLLEEVDEETLHGRNYDRRENG